MFLPFSFWWRFHQFGRPSTAAVIVNPAHVCPAGFTSGFSLSDFPCQLGEVRRHAERCKLRWVTAAGCLGSARDK